MCKRCEEFKRKGIDSITISYDDYTKLHRARQERDYLLNDIDFGKDATHCLELGVERDEVYE